MNLPRFPVRNEPADPLRPAPELWGPIAIREAGVLQDAVAFCDERVNGAHPSRCPLCGDQHCEGVAVVYGYPVYRCAGCGAGFVWPQPSDELLARYYGPRYWARYLGEEQPLYFRPELRDRILRRQAEYLDRQLRGNKAARILDVGSGDGSMLAILRDLGYRNAMGLELNPQNARRARERLQVDVRAEDFERFDVDGWDAITLWAVIEHLKHPLRFLERAHRLLGAGGKLVMLTGDNNSALARVQACFDCWMYPPEHLFFFDRGSLKGLLEKAGFVSVHCRIGLQNPLKEAAIFALQMAHAARARATPRLRPLWRSVNSNLLVAAGVRP